MDNNFYNILQTFKKLNEGVMSEIDLELREIVANEDFDALYNLFSANTPAGQYVQEIYNDVAIDNRLHPDDDFERIEELVFDRLADQFGEIEESQFAGQAVGQKPGDQWRGTDAGTPGKKLVGASESVEQECDTNASMSPIETKLRAMWAKQKQGLAEFGAGNPTNTSATDQQKNAETLQQTQQGINKLKAAGIAIQNPAQAAVSAVKTTTDPKANPATGQNMDQTSKKTIGALGLEMEKLLTTGNQNQINQVATAIKQAKQEQ